MSSQMEMQARHAAALGQLAELGLALAADIQRRALAAEDDDTAAKLADSFHKVGRAVRQSLALEARLTRDHARADREAVAEDERTRPLRIAQRQVAVRKAVERLIWNEVERGEDTHFCTEVLADLIGYNADLDDDFVDLPLDVVARRVMDRILRELDNGILEDDEDEDDASPEPELRNSA